MQYTLGGLQNIIMRMGGGGRGIQYNYEIYEYFVHYL